jgi:hypothetical protein
MKFNRAGCKVTCITAKSHRKDKEDYDSIIIYVERYLVYKDGRDVTLMLEIGVNSVTECL